jgi:hypothetical protein
MEASKLFVPGLWECPQCGFTQQNSTLSPAGVFASEKPELRPCPNDGRDLVAVTWETYAKQLLKTFGQVMNEREQLQREAETWEKRFDELMVTTALTAKERDEAREGLRAKLLAVAEKCFITGYETAMGEEANYDCALKRWRESLVKMDLETECQLAPPGWQCTRETGHEGPCAAVESGVGK